MLSATKPMTALITGDSFLSASKMVGDPRQVPPEQKAADKVAQGYQKGQRSRIPPMATIYIWPGGSCCPWVLWASTRSGAAVVLEAACPDGEVITYGSGIVNIATADQDLSAHGRIQQNIHLSSDQKGIDIDVATYGRDRGDWGIYVQRSSC
jgi:hypothetical protein